MSIALVKRARRRGFTLLEITLAVAILAMMSIAIYRFVAANLIAMRVSSEENAAEARYSGFINLLTAQWQDLPSGAGALSGEPFKFNDRPRDEITWICGSGPGLLTRYAPGEFLVSMRLRPVSEKADQMETRVHAQAAGDGRGISGRRNLGSVARRRARPANSLLRSAAECVGGQMDRSRRRCRDSSGW